MAGIPSLAMKREAPPSLPVFPQFELLSSFPTFFFARALDSVGIEGLTDRLRMLHRDAPFCRAELFVLRCLLRGRGDESHSGNVVRETKRVGKESLSETRSKACNVVPAN